MAVDRVDGEEGRALLAHLRAMTQRFRDGVRKLGLETVEGQHPVAPLLVRDTTRTAKLVAHLRASGILATGLAFPVVPKGEEEAAKRLQLLTTKPVLYVCNVEEASAATGNAFSEKVFAMAKAEGASAVVVSAAIEAEISQMAPADRPDFLESLGLHEGGLDRVIRAGYALLGLQTYFTVGPKEARAWTIEKGTRAPAAAGVIHTDFEKGFIRAETIAFADYTALKGESGAKEAGKFRLEGKDYVVQDGDVLHFRFAN